MVPELVGRVSADRTINPEELAGRLLCDIDAARAVLANLRQAHPSTRAAFNRWWATGEMENVSGEGTSVREIQERLRTDPLKALMTMDAILQGQLEPRDVLEADAKGR